VGLLGAWSFEMGWSNFLLVLCIASATDSCVDAFSSPHGPLRFGQQFPAQVAISQPSAGLRLRKRAALCITASGNELFDLADLTTNVEDKRVLYTAIYAAGHSLIAIPFALFWKVDRDTKVKAAAVALPFLVAWIALLGGWFR
jgi:hypothetical protein